MRETIYLSLNLQKMMDKREVILSDICQVKCQNKRVEQQIQNIKLYEFQHTEKGRTYKKVFQVLEIISLVEKIAPDAQLVFLGETEALVEYHEGPQQGRVATIGKTILASVLIFFGSAFTIMAFNNDISIEGVFEHFYFQMMGQEKPPFGALEIAYSLGLAVGIIVFFNHIGIRKLTDDVTPIEVEIHKHKQDTYETIIDKSMNQS